MNPNSRQFTIEHRTLAAMIDIYCREVHGSSGTICRECRDLVEYAKARLEKCPFGEQKPACSKCHVHCYKPAMRERVREVMKFAGPRMLTHHPVLAVRHLVRGMSAKPPTAVKGVRR